MLHWRAHFLPNLNAKLKLFACFNVKHITVSYLCLKAGIIHVYRILTLFMLYLCNLHFRVHPHLKTVITSAGGFFLQLFQTSLCQPGTPMPCSFPLVFILCRSIYLWLARATETSLKPNTGTNPFITLGFHASVCFLPLLQSIMFNSIGLTLRNQIWSFGYKFVFTRAAHLLMIICIWQFSRSKPETGSTQTVTRRAPVEGPACTGLPAACRPPPIYNLLLYCHRKEHNQPCRDTTEIH